MEVEPRIAKQYKFQYCCCVCKHCKGKVMEDWVKVPLYRFSANQKIAKAWGKCFWGASYSMSNKFLIVTRHILSTGLQKCL